MRRPIIAKKYLIRLSLCSVMLLLDTTQAYADTSKAANNNLDARIRQVVTALLKEKDQKIEALEARIKALDNLVKPSPVASAPPKLELGGTATKPTEAIVTNSLPPTDMGETHAAIAENSVAPNKTESSSLLSKLGDLGEEVAELKQAAAEKGLDITGFFDINAKTDNSTEQTFSIGSIELDLEYAYDDHVAASSAIVLCGNSSGAPFSAPAAITCGGSGPGGIGAEGAGFSVALVDYHWFDNRIPPRGRIFNNQGFHIQAGRFDLPFSTDYQYYANKDRANITAPITTSRMQFGGFNGDGLRSYGSWKHVNYAVFWTDAMYANDGSSVGGRLGVSFGQNIYRTHRANSEGFEVGFSHLSDLDQHRNLRHSVYGADLSLGYHFLRLQSEFMWVKAYDSFVGADETDYGKPNEFGYHATLLADLERFIHYPVMAVARYGRWQPDTRYANDYDGSLVAINNVSALTLGVNYTFNEHLKLKFEYTDSLGTSTQEKYFDKQLGIAQMVVAF